MNDRTPAEKAARYARWALIAACLAVASTVLAIIAAIWDLLT